MPRIFLVDDRPLLLASRYELLAHEPSLTIVGTAHPGPALLGQLLAASAEVVVLTLSGAGADGLASIRELRAGAPHLKVLIAATIGHERYVSQAFEAGAHGYLLQDGVKEEWLVAIKAVAAGRLFLCSALGLAMLHKVVAKQNSCALPANLVVNQLTRRESEVLHLLAQGLTTSEMAEKLLTSKRTIETHRQNIMEKTQTSNTASLIRQAILLGLLGGEGAPLAEE